MLCRMTLDPKRLPLVLLLGASTASAGSSNTCESLED
jgi:hypothetical protein